jgi:protein required for attachment to host cells
MGKVLAPKGFDPKFVRHWYLVANRIEAVVYAGRIGKDFHFVKRLKNPKGKLTETQLVADKPGRSFSRSRSGVRHGFAPHSLYHEQVAIQFARKIGKLLDRSLTDNEFTDLVVLAEPHFLGLMNQEFPEHVRKKVLREVPREWNEGSDRDLEKYLQKKLA